MRPAKAARQAKCQKLSARRKMAPPPGRPPASHVWDEGQNDWAHAVTGRRFDAAAHAQQVRAKKRECLRKHYWERGGRERRLARYTKNRKPKATQLKLASPPLRPGGRVEPQSPSGWDASNYAPTAHLEVAARAARRQVVSTIVH